jgi:hypothetical protein
MVMEEHVGGQRWRSMGRWPQQMKEEAGSALQRFLVEDTGSAASLAWLRGTREQCVVASAWREAEQSGRALGGCCRKWRERASLSNRQHEEMTHGAVATCVACGADVAAGQQRRREVVAAAQ